MPKTPQSRPANGKIMWLNPVGKATDDRLIADSISKIKSPYSLVQVTSLNTSPAPFDLEYRTYEAFYYGDIIRVIRYAASTGFDAAIIGCFYDPVLFDAREISADMIVIGPCLSSIQTMANLCNRFSVIVGSQKEVRQMTDNIHYYGYGRQLASIRAMNLSTTDFLENETLTGQAMLEQATLAIEHDYAEGIILGCTLQSGHCDKLQMKLGVPIIDCVYASFKMAEHFTEIKYRLGWKPSRKWSCAPPPEVDIEKYGLFQGPPPIGHAITLNPSSD